MDFLHYQPAPHVLDRLKQVDFVAVVGPTAVGKSTLIAKAIARQPELHLVLNNTTRAPRPGEREGVDYLFRTREEMEARIDRGEYVQVAPSVLGELYATAPEGYATSGVSLMAVLAEAMPVFRALPFKRIRTVFVTVPDLATWLSRMDTHGFTTEQRSKRLEEAKRSLQFALDDPDAKLMIDGDINTAVDDFITLVLDQPLSDRLKADQQKAKDVVRNLLAKLEQGI